MSALRYKKARSDYLFDVVVWTILIGVMFISVWPMYTIFIQSISDGNEVMQGHVIWFPKGITFKTYEYVLRDASILRALVNSIWYTSVGVLINLSFTAMCAYPLSRPKFSGKTFFTWMVTVTMLFSGGLIPLYLTVLRLGIMNTMWAVVLVPAINTWFMFILRTFFQQIPEELHESATIDGANDLYIFAKIVIPLSTPILATLLLFYAVGRWNAFLHPFMFLNEKAKYPLQIFLRNVVQFGTSSERNLIGASGDFLVAERTLRYATIMVTMAPILLVYPFVQKHVVKGIMVGSLKG